MSSNYFLLLRFGEFYLGGYSCCRLFVFFPSKILLNYLLFGFNFLFIWVNNLLWFLFAGGGGFQSYSSSNLFSASSNSLLNSFLSSKVEGSLRIFPLPFPPPRPSPLERKGAVFFGGGYFGGSGAFSFLGCVGFFTPLVSVNLLLIGGLSGLFLGGMYSDVLLLFSFRISAYSFSAMYDLYWALERNFLVPFLRKVFLEPLFSYWFLLVDSSVWDFLGGSSYWF